MFELVKELDETAPLEESGVSPVGKQKATDSQYPVIAGNLGCAEAIRTLLATEWGATEGRTEAELTAAMKSNAIRYSHGTISGLLTAMTRRDEIRRIGKKNGSYSYVIKLQ